LDKNKEGIMWDFTPIKYILKRLAGFRPDSLESSSSKSWEIAPAESTISLPAVYLPGSLSKIKKLNLQTSWDQERLRVEGGLVKHASTKAYELDSVKLLDGFLYKSNLRYPLKLGRPGCLALRIDQQYDEGVIASTLAGNTWFGHWLTDDLTLHLAADSLGVPISMNRLPYTHENEYLQMLSLHALKVSRACFKKIVILQDYGQNSYKRSRYEELRRRIAGGSKRDPAIGVYFRRGRSGSLRLIVNEEEIENHLKTLGFKIIDPETCSVQEIVEASLGAKYMIGCEGSQMAHGIFTIALNGILLCLQPPNGFTAVHKDYADCIGYRYGFLVGDPASQGFSINLKELDCLLELAMK
jgi:Glycosyltransferase 61